MFDCVRFYVVCHSQRNDSKLVVIGGSTGFFRYLVPPTLYEVIVISCLVHVFLFYELVASLCYNTRAVKSNDLVVYIWAVLNENLVAICESCVCIHT